MMIVAALKTFVFSISRTYRHLLSEKQYLLYSRVIKSCQPSQYHRKIPIVCFIVEKSY